MASTRKQQDEELHPGPVNPQAYRHSVTAEVRGEYASKGIPAHRKYILSIAAHSDPAEPKVVPIRNGDLQYNLVRGRYWIVPEAIVNVLKDATGDQINSEGLIAGRFKSYPYQATRYDGELPLKAECDENGDPIGHVVPEYPQ